MVRNDTSKLILTGFSASSRLECILIYKNAYYV